MHYLASPAKRSARRSMDSATFSNGPNGGLAPYSGEWTFELAAHLLRRSMYGPTMDQIEWSVKNGLEATVEKLFQPTPMPAPPVYYDYSGDPNVPNGQTWINAPYRERIMEDQILHRLRSIHSWTLEQPYLEGMSIREKLTLFWHNHFPIRNVHDPRFDYDYLTLLRQNATGNFRELTKLVTVNAAMLHFLNGNRNEVNSPNENYARELLELFTIGKGPQVGPGDYTNYTEEDVKEVARVLTGWIDYGYRLDSANGEFGARFISSRHDTGVKQLSHRFNNAQISNKGKDEYAFIIDLIFKQKEVARHLCRRLFRWFVYYEINEEVESRVIEPMAQILFENDFEIQPAVKALLCSEMFFESKYEGAMFKNPLDMVLSAIKPFRIPVPNRLIEKGDTLYMLIGWIHQMGLEYFQVPEVAGWRAYYVEPVFYRDWITSPTLATRITFLERLATLGHLPAKGNGPRVKPDVLAFTASLESPLDPNAVVSDYVRLLLPRPLSAKKRDELKDILIPGLPDFEWTVEFGQYLEDPGNSKLANAIETKLRTFVMTLYTLAEFQLS